MQSLYGEVKKVTALRIRPYKRILEVIIVCEHENVEHGFMLVLIIDVFYVYLIIGEN